MCSNVRSFPLIPGTLCSRGRAFGPQPGHPTPRTRTPPVLRRRERKAAFWRPNLGTSLGRCLQVINSKDKDGGDLEKPYVVAHEPLAWLNSNSIKDKMKKTWASRRPSLM